MQNDTINQLYVFGIFILNGLLIGILFDIFRISRKTFKTSNLITYVEDILFWILTGLLLLFSIFKFNNGEIRGYIFLGILIGIFSYMLFISKYFIYINVKIINTIKYIISLIIKILLYPLKLLYKIIIKPIKILYKYLIANNVEKFLKMFNNIKKSKKIEHKEGF